MFLGDVPKVMEALGLRYFSQMVHLTDHDLRGLAHQQMVSLARTVLEIQRRESPKPISVMGHLHRLRIEHDGLLVIPHYRSLPGAGRH